METMATILGKYVEFNAYLNGIDLVALCKQYSRKELELFATQLSSVNIRSLSYETRKLTDAMKLEEFPELKGVHHYPEIKTIEFLTEEEKIAVDEHLVRFRVGNVFSNSSIFRIINSESKREETIEFLLKHAIIEREFFVLCPHCNEGHISNRLSGDAKERLENAIRDKASKDRHVVLDECLRYYCDECELDYDLSALTELQFETIFVLKKERDKSLDGA